MNTTLIEVLLIVSGNCSRNYMITPLLGWPISTNLTPSCDYYNYKTRFARLIIENTKLASLVP